MLLRGLDSRLSKDLPSDLQKLRCKVFVGFHFSFDLFCLIFMPFYWESLGLAVPKNFIIEMKHRKFSGILKMSWILCNYPLSS